MEQTFIPQTLHQLVAALEAILFVSPEPVAEEELGRLTGWDGAGVRAALELLQERMAADDRGLCLQRVDGGWQLATKPHLAGLLAPLLGPRPPAPLSQAALETLAIIAYRQPVTRAEIEQLRGVRAESALQSLLDRGLVEEAGRADGPGRPILYRTTRQFLQWCGLHSLADLPPLPEAPQAGPADALPAASHGPPEAGGPPHSSPAEG
ncbi:MAG TPA: SMC-Scp complex subunit ScpB [Limnochordales bacterium]|nr:SMC-Scp complex subunit ScpB [Limnochordales bacterium]